MRSNSGRDEARNNLHDPTLRPDGEEPRDPKKSKLKAPADQRIGRKD